LHCICKWGVGVWFLFVQRVTWCCR
jgi:hypothetical protein